MLGEPNEVPLRWDKRREGSKGRTGEGGVSHRGLARHPQMPRMASKIIVQPEKLRSPTDPI